MSKIENYMDSPFLDWFKVLSLCAVNEVMPGRLTALECQIMPATLGRGHNKQQY